MSTAAVVIGVSLVIVLVIALVFAVRRCYRPANRYRRGIPNLARARERPRSGRLDRQVLLALITPAPAVAAAVAVAAAAVADMDALHDLDEIEHSASTKGIAVIQKTVLCAVVIGVSATLTSSAVAQANPATPMPVIESSAAQLCGAINAQPTQGGVIDGMNSLENRGLDEMDGALVLITAIHHVCPQHEALMMGTMGPIAAEEICTKPS